MTIRIKFDSFAKMRCTKQQNRSHCQTRNLGIFDFPVIPHNSYSGPRIEINALTQDVDLSSLHSELRGISDDVEDLQYDHLSKISSAFQLRMTLGRTRKSRPDQIHENMNSWQIIEVLMNW